MRVAIVIMDGVADSGLALLRDVFDAANLLAYRVDSHIDTFDVSLVAVRPEVRTGYGLLATAQPLAEVFATRPDHVLVPSLGIVTADDVVHAVASSELPACLSELHDGGIAVAAACSGVFFLAEAGLLAGRAATTSWWLGPAFRLRFPDVLLDESQALVISDSVTTAGAAIAHLDLALSIVRRVSPALADAVGDYLAVGDRPQQGEVIRPSMLEFSDPVLVAFDREVRDNIAVSLDVGRVAGSLGVSQRTLQRLTAGALGMTPVRYIQQVRLERAIDLLRSTDLGVGAVAHAVGYRDATTLGTLLRRRRGVTPEQVRRRRGVSAGTVRLRS